MPVLVLLSVAGLGMQQCMFWNRNEMYKLSKVKNGCKYAAYNKQFYATFPWQDFFPDTSLIFSKIPDISLTAVKFPDISRFSRQVVSLQILTLIPACNWQQRVAVTAKQITYRQHKASVKCNTSTYYKLKLMLLATQILQREIYAG